MTLDSNARRCAATLEDAAPPPGASMLEQMTSYFTNSVPDNGPTRHDSKERRRLATQAELCLHRLVHRKRWR